jgi:hypothetical protein
VIVIIAYLGYELLRPVCDSIFEQTTPRVAAKVNFLQTQGEVLIGREQVQALTESSQKVGLYLKACCVAQTNGHVSAKQIQACIDGAKNYESNIVQASNSLQEARLANDRGNTQLETEKVTQASQSIGAASGEARRLEKVAAEVSAGAPPPGPALEPTASRPGEVNLLAPDEGGHLLVAPSADWEKVITGNEADMVDANPGEEAVFGFRGDKAARFWKFAVLVPNTYWDNLKEFELLVGSDSLIGSFQSLGKFSTQNIKLIRTPYQEFQFQDVTGKYLKLKVLSTYNTGAGWGRLKQVRLFGIAMQ